MTTLETPKDTALRHARATLADIAHASDGDITRACDTLIEFGTPDERASAVDIKLLIEGETEDHRCVTVHPPVGHPRCHAAEITNVRAGFTPQGGRA